MVGMMVILLGGAILAGFAGSLLGLGGGILLIPIFTLALGWEIHRAIGTSLIAVVATSSAAGSIYTARGVTNLKLGMLLEVGTTIGGITGAFVAIFLTTPVLEGLFALGAVYAAYYMATTRETHRWEEPPVATEGEAPRNPLERIDLSGDFIDPRTGIMYYYRPERKTFGLTVSYFAGVMSGLLGIGGGPIKVPAMNSIMRVPMRVAVATSNFMIGVTAAASAFIYYNQGFVEPVTAGLAFMGVFLGAMGGLRVSIRVRGATLKRAFSGVLAVLALFMALGALGLVVPP